MISHFFDVVSLVVKRYTGAPVRAIKAYRGSRSITELTLTLDLEVNGQYHAPVAFPQAKKIGTHWIEGCVGPGAGLHDFGEEKNFTK
jgi:hypothetical protein